MRKGRLNRAELGRCAKIWRQLEELRAQLPADYRTHDKIEESTCKCLVEARNAIGDLLRWQDHALYQRTEKEARNEQTLATGGAATRSTEATQPKSQD